MTPNPWLETPQLGGKHICLEPLHPLNHAAEMFKHFEAHATTYTGRGYHEIHSVLEMGLVLQEAKQRLNSLHWAIRLLESGEIGGRVLWMNVSSRNRSAEIGTLVMPKFWGSPANIESKLLLLTRAFEVLNMVRVEFLVDTENARSIGSMEKLGAVREGVKRSGQIHPNGSVRDQIVYSIIASDWHGIKSRLEEHLARF